MKTNKHTSMGIAMGMCFGVAMGTSLGQLIFDNISIGMSMGICFGMLVGMSVGHMKDKEINRQLEEQGYTIKEIEKEENEENYKIIIQDKNGGEISILVSESVMKKERFNVGNIVFLGEDGTLEQAFRGEDEI